MEWSEARRHFGSFSVDEDIEDFVLELVRRGYSTIGSCAGHIGYGYIESGGRLDKEELRDVREVGEQYGLEDVRLSYSKPADITMMTFKPVSLLGRQDFWGEGVEAIEGVE